MGVEGRFGKEFIGLQSYGLLGFEMTMEMFSFEEEEDCEDCDCDCCEDEE